MSVEKGVDMAKVGRPRGKKSDPNYVQICGYVTRTTYRAVKIRCFETDQEISQVLQHLLDEWLAISLNQNAENPESQPKDRP